MHSLFTFEQTLSFRMGIDNTESFNSNTPDAAHHRHARPLGDVPDDHDALLVAASYDNNRRFTPNQSNMNTSYDSQLTASMHENILRPFNRNNIKMNNFPVNSLDHSTPIRTGQKGSNVTRRNTTILGSPVVNYETRKYPNLVRLSDNNASAFSNGYAPTNQPSQEHLITVKDGSSSSPPSSVDEFIEANPGLALSTARLFNSADGARSASSCTSTSSTKESDRNAPFESCFPENNSSLKSDVNKFDLEVGDAEFQVNPNGTEERKGLEKRVAALERNNANNASQVKNDPSQFLESSTEAVSERTLPKDFKKFYKSLNLDKVDELSELQCKNMIKNIMLSLLITDFEHLPQKMQQLGVYIAHTANFVDDVHQALYGSMETNPLDYLLKADQDVNEGFKECLAGMTSLLLLHLDYSRTSGQ